MCGGIPLALLIIASMLKADTALSAGRLAEELAIGRERLQPQAYGHGGCDLPPSIAGACVAAYRRLEEAPALMFCLLPVIPGPDASTSAAAALAGISEAQAQMALEQLVRAHLVEATPGITGRWRLHDLLRLAAEWLSDARTATDQRERARDRLLDHYLTMAEAADAILRAQPGTAMPGQFASQADAFAWLEEEFTAITAAVSMAANTGRDQVAWRLPLALAEYFRRRPRFDDWLPSVAISIDSARRLGDRHGEGVALDSMGLALSAVNRMDEAIAVYKTAAAIFANTGDRQREGVALISLSAALRAAGQFDEAIIAGTDAVAVLQHTGDRHGEAVAMDSFGLALVGVNRYEEAATAHKEAAVIFWEVGDGLSEAKALENFKAASDAQAAWD